MDAKTQDTMMTHLIQKIRKNRNRILDYEGYFLDKADIVIVTYGSSVRPALRAMRVLREDGIPVGLLKLNTVWPFAEDLIRKLAKNVEAFVVPEVNFGQISLEVERCSSGKALTHLISHAGGGIHTPQQVVEGIKEALRLLGRGRTKR
jgi:2-oxoglutarate ferredoxin oxidoreductase subunit alpha